MTRKQSKKGRPFTNGIKTKKRVITLSPEIGYLEDCLKESGVKSPAKLVMELLDKHVLSRQDFLKSKKNEINLLSDEEIDRRADEDSSVPETYKKEIEVKKRSEYVKASTLRRAKGVCEGCEKDAPFRKDDGTPFLEVHHKVWLSEGGEDSRMNAIALCPNCHRNEHFGQRYFGNKIEELSLEEK